MPKAKSLAAVALDLPAAITATIAEKIPPRFREKLRAKHSAIISQAATECAAKVVEMVEHAVLEAEHGDKVLQAPLPLGRAGEGAGS